MKDRSALFWILKWFFIWRILLQIIVLFVSKSLPLQESFLGGDGHYLDNPGFWSWMNFDAEHYLSIARNGYKPLQYFYFPFYPILVQKLAYFLSFKYAGQYALLGLLVSHTSFFAALIGLYKLVRSFYSKNITRLSILLLLFFPTSYYFVSFYTESIFLLLIVWTFYFARQEKWEKVGAVGLLASSARSIGVILLPALVLEFLIKHRKKITLNEALQRISILLIPLGLLGYMYYLKLSTGSYLSFNESGYIFGEYRSATPVLLPQVYYRYIFKIIPNLNYSYFPVVFTTFLEFLSATLMFTLLIYGVKKIPSSWYFYMLGGFIVPTLYLNFVSMPRYAVVLFPAFVLLAKFLNNKSKLKTIYFSVSCLGLVIALSLFSRGYWIS